MVVDEGPGSVCLCSSDSKSANYLSDFIKHLPRVTQVSECRPEVSHILWLDDSGLAVGPRDLERRHAIQVDFSDPVLLHRLKTSGKRQGIGKAVGLDKASAAVNVLDATAGFGRDALVLAHLGCRVTMLERSPVVHALLADGLRRAADSEFAHIREAVTRMHLLHTEASAYLGELLATGASLPDVITLDPMFPPSQKAALVKKSMNMLQQLLGPDQDLEVVLGLARQCALKRVVVKRPPRQVDIPGAAPAFTLTSKAAHFAVYVNSSFSSTP